MASTAAWGMTAQEARSLLSAAQGKGTVRVRTRGEHNSKGRHAGIGVLLKVLNERQALIQPDSHQKTETVELSSIKNWHSPNAQQGIIPTFEEIEPEGEPISISDSVNRFIIYSAKMGGCWNRGRNIWGKNICSVSYFSKERAEVIVKQLKGAPMSDDVRFVTREEAFILMSSTMPKSVPVSVPTPPHLSRAFLEPKPSHSEPKPLPLIPVHNRHEVTNPVSSIVTPSGSSMMADIGIDVDAILSGDGNALQYALESQKKAAETYKRTFADFTEAKEELLRATKEVNEIMGRMAGGTAPKASEGSKIKRGAVPDAIRQILTESSRLDLATIKAKVKGMLGEVPDTKITGTINHLRTADELERDAGGNYYLKR